MGKREIRPLATPKPLNRSSPKVAHVIRSRMSTKTQNLVMIPRGVSFPRMREIAHQRCLLGFFLCPGSSNDLQPRRLNRFSRVIRQTTRFRARMCFFGVRKRKQFNSYTRSSGKTAILGPILTAQKIYDRKPLYNGVLPCKLPLIVVVAP